MDKPKTLLAGIDTLEIGYNIGGYRYPESMFRDLAEAKAMAQVDDYSKDNGPIDFFGKKFVVYRSGIPRYKYMLQNADVTILICDKPQGGLSLPEVRVQFRSAYLWRKDWFEAAREVEAWIRSWAEVFGHKISRADAMVDVAMPIPKLRTDLRDVVSRVNKKNDRGTLTLDYERSVEGLHESGYTFGRGDCVHNIYDKVREIKVKSGRTDFYGMWKRNCPEMEHVNAETWEDGPPVTRYEFQMRRGFLKRFGIDTIGALKKCLPGLWEYLTGEWLTICRPSKDTNRSRWKARSFWKVVQQAVSMFGQSCGVARIKQVKPRYKRLEQQAIGLLKSMAALASMSIGGGNPVYGKKFVDRQLRNHLWGPPNQRGPDSGRAPLSEFDHGVIRREHLYASMSA